MQESQSQQKEVGKESAAETHEEQLGTPGESTAAPEPTRPHTPPPKHEEFENFKKEAGSEINRLVFSTRKNNDFAVRMHILYSGQLFQLLKCQSIHESRILTENKEILGSKKKAYADLARQINTTKQQIDESKEKLDQLRDSREAQGVGRALMVKMPLMHDPRASLSSKPNNSLASRACKNVGVALSSAHRVVVRSSIFQQKSSLTPPWRIADIEYNEDGDLIISEEEYLEIKRLKDLKAVYRNDFDELRNLKSEVQYCQKLVDQCRQRLVQGALRFYLTSFAGVLTSIIPAH